MFLLCLCCTFWNSAQYEPNPFALLVYWCFSSFSMKFITYQKNIYIPFVMLALFLDFGQFRGTYMILIDSILNVKGLWARKRLAELISIFIETQK